MPPLNAPGRLILALPSLAYGLLQLWPPSGLQTSPATAKNELQSGRVGFWAGSASGDGVCSGQRKPTPKPLPIA
jgi:hypothetical protein